MIFTDEDAARLSPLFKGRIGRLLFKAGAKLTAVDKVNLLHKRVEDSGAQPGPDFAHGILEDVGIDFRIGHPERLSELPEGPFVVIANHVYGHLDGICLVDIIGHARPGTKVMVNEFINQIRGMAPSFICVNPTLREKKGATSTSINGVKSALQQLHCGLPLCIFPSGAVADLQPREHWTINEREWQDAAVRLIRKARVPVVPVRFFDYSSRFYYILGLIDYRVRLLRLCHEVFNKRGTCPRMGIGPIVSVAEQEAVPDSEFKDFLRQQVYNMPLPDHFVKRSELWK